MKAKDKAKELVDKYSGHSYISLTNNPTTSYHRKQCALICVDEIINIPSIQIGYSQGFSKNNNSTESYWREVKKEINKL
jgi:hypothetical protein